jgi:hypothetical protein
MRKLLVSLLIVSFMFSSFVIAGENPFNMYDWLDQRKAKMPSAWFSCNNTSECGHVDLPAHGFCGPDLVANITHRDDVVKVICLEPGACGGCTASLGYLPGSPVCEKGQCQESPIMMEKAKSQATQGQGSH